MISYVLIIVLNYGIALNSSSTVFQDHASCEKARTKIVNDINDARRAIVLSSGCYPDKVISIPTPPTSIQPATLVTQPKSKAP